MPAQLKVVHGRPLRVDGAAHLPEGSVRDAFLGKPLGLLGHPQGGVGSAHGLGQLGRVILGVAQGKGGLVRVDLDGGQVQLQRVQTGQIEPAHAPHRTRGEPQVELEPKPVRPLAHGQGKVGRALEDQLVAPALEPQLHLGRRLAPERGGHGAVDVGLGPAALELDLDDGAPGVGVVEVLVRVKGVPAQGPFHVRGCPARPTSGPLCPGPGR